LGTGTKGAVTTLNGVRVVSITDSAIDTHKPTTYVTDTSIKSSGYLLLDSTSRWMTS